jgi:hypothetical protein
MDEITRLAASSSGVSSPQGGFSSVVQSCSRRIYSSGTPYLDRNNCHIGGYSLPDQPSFYHSLSLHRWHSRSKYDGSHRSRGVCQPSWVKDNGHTHCSGEPCEAAHQWYGRAGRPQRLSQKAEEALGILVRLIRSSSVKSRHV